MKRCSACIGLLAGLIVLCITSLFVIHAQCRRYTALAETVAAAVESGNTADALEKFDTLDAGWDNFHDICGLFVDGKKLDPIRDQLSELRPLIASEHPEAASGLEKLHKLIEGIFEEEIPALWHIL